MTSTQSPSPATSYPLSFQSTAASLPSFFARRPLFSIACSLFSQNTRVGGTSTLPRQAALPKGAHFAKGCKNTETATLTTFRINTCKSVSKQRTLTIFRMNTYAKQGGGGAPYSEGPSGRKYCVPLTGSCRRRSNCCKSALRSTKSISEV